MSFTNTFVFYPKDDLRMIFSRPVTCSIKNISINSDFTFYANENDLTQETIFNYTVAMRNHSIKQISNIKVSFIFGEETIPLTVKRILSKEKVSKKLSKIRFSSLISVEDSKKLLNSKDVLYLCIEYEETTYQIEARKLRVRLDELSNII